MTRSTVNHYADGMRLGWASSPPRTPGAGLVASAQRGGVRAAHFLAILPLLDIISGQVHAQWKTQPGTLSVPQVYHATVLVIASILLFSRLQLHGFPRAFRYALTSAGCLFGALLLSAACVLAEGKLTFEALVANAQVAYWLVIWLTVLAIRPGARDCKIILGRIILAGVYAGLAIVYLYVNEGERASIYEKLVGNAAGFGTAKGLTGILATAGLVSVWLLRERAKVVGAIILLVCAAGMLLTYQRAGLVGLAVATVWLAAWYGSRARHDRKAGWALRPILLVMVAVVVVLGAVGTADIEKRWEDLSNDEKAGSGRVAFWQVSLAHYAEMDLLEQVSGIGYTGTAEAMERRYGARIHTHSDPLDALLMFGAAGLLALAFVYAAVWRGIWRARASGQAFAIGAAIYIVMLCQSLLTGQILSPSTMFCYLTAITCACLIGAAEAGPAPLPRQGKAV